MWWERQLGGRIVQLTLVDGWSITEGGTAGRRFRDTIGRPNIYD
jgi:hypothetical protein